jgi:uncharacterized protein (DUF1810 family)
VSGTLDRFLDAQDARYAGYDAALGEIRQGHKRSHWIWYIFPQLAGLGQSGISQTYGIDGRGEATAYLQHPLLRARLLEIATAVEEQLNRGIPILTLMGSDIDAKKLVSSMTLFREVAERVDGDLEQAAGNILDRAAAQGYPPCAFTLTSLRAAH